MLILYKIVLKSRTVTKERWFYDDKQCEFIKHNYEHGCKYQKYMNHILTKLKGETDNSVLTVKRLQYPTLNKGRNPDQRTIK